MKKIILFIVLGFKFQIVFGQTYRNPYVAPTKVDVTVKKNPYDFSSSFNQGLQSGAAIQQAAANNRAANAQQNLAYNEAMKDNYSKIILDNFINNDDKFDYVVIENIGGWSKSENKNKIIEILKEAKKYEIIDISPDYKSNGKEIKNDKTIPNVLMNNKRVLFLNWLREAQGDYHRITQLTIKNSDGIIIYQSTSKNLSLQEILKPLISDYFFTKDMALTKIGELKNFLELGVISKEEYDKQVADLKPILLGKN